jgi:hypothetical protein
MWWENLSNLQQLTFVTGTIATVIMILFIVLMLLGMEGGETFDGDIDFDGDFDAGDLDVYNADSVSSISGLRIVTIRGALAFFSIGSWTTYLLSNTLIPILAIAIGIVAGVIAAILLAITMKAVLKLESSGNLDYSTAIGKIATVYIRIPKKSMGKGKINFNHQGKLVEVDAVTTEDEDILRKSEVVIINLIDDTTLVVKKI